ncbi:MAG: hypothetical protein AAFY42_05780 [Pseudomonadota bacterium]
MLRSPYGILLTRLYEFILDRLPEEQPYRLVAGLGITVVISLTVGVLPIWY